MNPPDIYAGYWAVPDCKSSNSYHRYADERSPSLCGRWQAGSHRFNTIERRLNIIRHMDCQKCQTLFKAQMAALPPDRYVCTHNAHLAWLQQTHPVASSKSSFTTAARHAGVREFAGTRMWDGYYWNATDLLRLLNVDVPPSPSDRGKPAVQIAFIQ